MKKQKQSTHGGPGRGQGRHPRTEPKAKPVWCGQISEQQRAHILETLTPEERLAALLQAAAAKVQAEHH